jgi:hypothetical protein
MQAGRRAGQAEMEAGAEDLTSALVAGSFRDRGLSERRDRVLSRMRARTGASGVAMEGSALEVLTNAAGQAARDLIVSRMATEQEVAAARTRIRSGSNKKQGAVIGGLLEFGASALKIKQFEDQRYKPERRDEDFGPDLSKPPGDLAVPEDWKWGE